MTRFPDLSCYTTNLVAYLEPKAPAIRRTLARAIRFAVRTDLPAGELAFSHHPKLDADETGQLAYRSAPDWDSAHAALRDELDRTGRVLACCNTFHLPWSPACRLVHTPHWVLLHRLVDGRWLVADHFAALTPHGRQEPYRGWLSDHQLRAALSSMDPVSPELINRDRHALGLPVELPSYSDYRWLAFVPTPPVATSRGEWLEDTASALRFVADNFAADDSLIARHVDDIWTASRHFRYRLSMDVDTGRIAGPAARAESDAWEELPKALRFAATSLARGRPRPSLIARAFAQLISAIEAAQTPEPTQRSV